MEYISGICCFTGHRRIPDRDMIRLPSLLGEIIAEQIRRGVTTFRAGGAIGFDMLAALKVIHLRQTHPQIRLELCLPCTDQAARWDANNRSYYDFVLQNSDKVRYVQQLYAPGCMAARNRMLVQGADVCVAYCSGGGGTAQTCGYALAQKLQLINLYDILRERDS